MENVHYTRTELPQRDVDKHEYTDLQHVSPDEVTVSTDSQKVHYDNGNSNGNNNGPFSNASKNAYTPNPKPTEKSILLSFSQPSSRKGCYTLIIAALIVFIFGFILGILIGNFAIDHKSEAVCDSSNSKADEQSGGKTCTCPTFPTFPTVDSSTFSFPECSCPTPPPPVPSSCTKCEKRSPRSSSLKESPFAPLTGAEIDKVMKKINAEQLTGPVKGLGGNYIDYIYLFPVEKSKALKYLDNGDPFPPRYAKVHITRGSAIPPDVMIYKIGPLNETVDKMVVEKLVNDGEIHFNRRSYDSKEHSGIYNAYWNDMFDLKTLLKESFDGAYLGSGLSVSCSTLYSLDENDRRSGCYAYFYMSTGGSTLRILPLSFIVHHPGVNTSNWYASDFYYLNQGPYASGRELAEDYENGTLRKFQLPSRYRYTYGQEYSLLMNRSLPLRENSEIPPPRTYEPRGPRYTIRGNEISWMDWECEYTVDPIKGPAIFNVKFKGNRIAYEISLQDITLLYASGTPGAGVNPPALSDTEFSLGNAIRSARLGFGCPSRASVLHANVYNKGNRNKEVACVFEADPQRPMWRHFNNGVLDHHLVIRAPMNLGNYDYTMEFRFYLDGRLETIMAASGTLYGAFWDPEDPLLDLDKSTSPFGFRIGNYLSGPIHTHDFVFKVDLDILGTENSFEKINWKGGDILAALNSQINTQERPGFFPFNRTRYIETELLKNEAGLVIDPLNPSYWTVVNENEKNKWGVKRGYRIIPTFADSEPELITHHLMFNSWPNMKYHCAVTKRKDSEPYGTDSIYDIRRPTDPIGGLNKLMDGENIRNKDLVMWVTAKFTHAPTSEDVPMTIGVDKGFVLKPFNYFDVTPTFDVQGHYDGTGDPYERLRCYEP